MAKSNNHWTFPVIFSYLSPIKSDNRGRDDDDGWNTGRGDVGRLAAVVSLVVIVFVILNFTLDLVDNVNSMLNSLSELILIIQEDDDDGMLS